MLNSRTEATANLNNALATLPHCHVPIKIVVETGDNVAETIFDQANRLQADLIIMSRNGRSGLSRGVFGSMTKKVLRGGCASLIVRS